MINKRLKDMQEDQQGGPTPEEIKELLQQSILRHYPNPERKGCPGTPALHEMAELRLPFEDSRWDHVERCSQCYREYLDFRHEFKRGQKNSKTLKVVTATAATIIICVSVSFWFAGDHSAKIELRASSIPATQSPPNRLDESPTPILNASLDLQNQSLKRSAANESISERELPHIPRGHLALAISLPIGTATGEYTARLLKSEADSESLLNFSGVADMEKGVTVLRVTADLSRFAPGLYVLAIRHDQYSWAYYRFVVT